MQWIRGRPLPVLCPCAVWVVIALTGLCDDHVLLRDERFYPRPEKKYLNKVSKLCEYGKNLTFYIKGWDVLSGSAGVGPGGS